MSVAADEGIWESDPAGWPDDSAAWPGGQEAWPDEDREPQPDEPPSDELLPVDSADAASPAGRVPEALPAGFTHRDVPGWGPGYACPSPSGFAAGGPADTLEPGPVLAGLTSHAWDDGLSALGDDELVGVLCAARRVCSWQAALELAAVAELDTRRTRQARDVAAARAARSGSAPAAETHTSEELVAALVLTRRAADTLLALATGLAALPAVAAALASGVIDQARAAVFTDELAALDVVDAAAIAATILPRAADLTTGQLRAALRRAVLAFDPAAARRRRERAAAEGRVETWAESSGNGALAGRELSPAEVIAAERYLATVARGLQAAGAPGTMDQLQKAAFAALLSGRSPESLLGMPGSCGPAASPPPARQPNGSGDERGSFDAAGCGPGSGAGSGAGSGVSWPAGPLGTIHLTMPLLAWLGLSEAPGSVAALGPLDSTTCRDLASMVSGWSGTRWCLTITTPEGRALGHACTKTGPPRAGESAAGPPGAGPSGAGPPGTGPPGTGPPGTGPPRAGLSGTGPPRAGPPGAAQWLAGLKIHWLETGACGHSRETGAYRPSPKLRHLVKTRNPTCCFPGCRRPASSCDDDHTLAYERGGRTCECNLASLCRAHHRTKQSLGWQLEQPQPGVLIWTAPHGRRYPAAVEPYPV